MGSSRSPGASRRPLPRVAALLVLAAGLAACGGGEVRLPPPRPIVITSGARLRPDTARMDSVYAWLNKENTNIEEDPSFFIDPVPAARENMPWQTLTISAKADTARFQYDRAHPDITTAFNVYAHLHLMAQRHQLSEWLPEDSTAQGFQLERAIVGRMADAWLLGRAVFDAPAYGPLDELVYAKDAGYLEPYILMARGQDFAQERAAWESGNPGRMDTYREWFRRNFNHEPPGFQAPPGVSD